MKQATQITIYTPNDLGSFPDFTNDAIQSLNHNWQCESTDTKPTEGESGIAIKTIFTVAQADQES